MELDEQDLNQEVTKPPLEYVTHEEYTMSMEKEANRKLKAEIRRGKKLGLKKVMMGKITVMYYDSNL